MRPRLPQMPLRMELRQDIRHLVRCRRPLAVLAGVGIELTRRRRLRWLDLAPVAAAASVIALSFQRPLFKLILSDQFESLAQLNRSDWVFFWY